VILPITVVRRFYGLLQSSKDTVLAENGLRQGQGLDPESYAICKKEMRIKTRPSRPSVSATGSPTTSKAWRNTTAYSPIRRFGPGLPAAFAGNYSLWTSACCSAPR
jgi:hypothetical protein